MGADKIFLEIAKSDLLSARLLYSKELYPQAVFYLQQSIEKVMKSFAILMDIMEEDKTKKWIGHNPLKLQRKLLNRLKEGFEGTPSLKEFSLFEAGDMGKVYGNILDFQKLLDHLIETKPIYLSRQEIMQLIGFANEFELEMKELNDRMALARNEDFYYAFDETEKILSNILNTEAIKKEINAMVLGFKESVEEIRLGIGLHLKSSYVYLSIFCLSIITFPHAVISRYPDENFNPLGFYNKKLPLMQLFDECSTTTSKVLAELEELTYIIDKDSI